MLCAKCGKTMRMTEKDTSSGRDIREYLCDDCGHTDWEDNGTALWQALHDYREAEEANLLTPAAQPAPEKPHQEAPRSIWGRLRGWLTNR